MDTVRRGHSHIGFLTMFNFYYCYFTLYVYYEFPCFYLKGKECYDVHYEVTVM